MRLTLKATSNVEAASQRQRKEGGKDYGPLSHAARVFSAMATSIMYAEHDSKKRHPDHSLCDNNIPHPKAPPRYPSRDRNCENRNADTRMRRLLDRSTPCLRQSTQTRMRILRPKQTSRVLRLRVQSWACCSSGIHQITFRGNGRCSLPPSSSSFSPYWVRRHTELEVVQVDC